MSVSTLTRLFSDSGWLTTYLKSGPEICGVSHVQGWCCLSRVRQVPLLHPVTVLFGGIPPKNQTVPMSKSSTGWYYISFTNFRQHLDSYCESSNYSPSCLTTLFPRTVRHRAGGVYALLDAARHRFFFEQCPTWRMQLLVGIWAKTGLQKNVFWNGNGRPPFCMFSNRDYLTSKVPSGGIYTTACSSDVCNIPTFFILFFCIFTASA